MLRPGRPHNSTLMATTQPELPLASIPSLQGAQGNIPLHGGVRCRNSALQKTQKTANYLKDEKTRHGQPTGATQEPRASSLHLPRDTASGQGVSRDVGLHLTPLAALSQLALLQRCLGMSLGRVGTETAEGF